MHHRPEGSTFAADRARESSHLWPIPATTRVPYAGRVVRRAARSLWSEPRAPAPPARVWRDWALVAVLVPAALLEGMLREDLAWRGVAIVLCLAVVAMLPWRHTHPLAVVAAAFGAASVVRLAALITGQAPVGLDTTVCVVLLPYSLFRWGSGREAAIGLAIILVADVVGITEDSPDVGVALFGTMFLLFPAALGASVRYRSAERLREVDQVKLREREQLARELHDTIGHHDPGTGRADARGRGACRRGARARGHRGGRLARTRRDARHGRPPARRSGS